MRVVRLAARIWVAVLLVQSLLLAGLLVARLVALPRLSEQPRLLATEPADGATRVAPRTALVLRFSEPMNSPSVERALRVEPPVPAVLRWDAPRTTLTISPTAGLAPDTLYRVTLGGDALGRLFRPLEEEAGVAFRTAPAPAVVAVFPGDGAAGVTLDAPVSIRFSRPIVTQAALAQPRSLPELRFDPPLAGVATWLDERTVLFRPAAPLLPGTRYRATLDASLADVVGAQLGREFGWEWSTQPPRVVGVSPAPGARLDEPRAPLRLTLSHPVALDQLRDGLTLTPPIDGALSDGLLPDGTQLVTFTPTIDWQPSTTYQAEIHIRQAGAAPTEPFRWSFSAPARPSLVGRFPGEGQTLPSGRELRLVFSTPMDAAALQDALRFDPPVDGLRVIANGAETRVAAELRAATAYTVTLPAELQDRGGQPLGREYRLRFVTASAAPSLALPQARRHVLYAAPGPPASLLVRRTNLTQLSLELYRLDSETVVRALSFREGDWPAFQPERYGQPRVRSWTVPITDTLNAVAEEVVPVATEAGDLPAGAYFLRVLTPEGPRADTLLLASGTRLTLRPSSAGLLVWATDAASDAALPGLPLALYQSGAQIRQGTTDADGLWEATEVATGRPLVVAAVGGQPAAVAAELPLGDALPSYRMALASDRAEYRPGDRVAIAGFVRRLDDAVLPPSVRVAIVSSQGRQASLAAPVSASVAGDGAFRAEFTLEESAAPGAYALVASVEGVTHELPFTVLPREPQPLTVGVRAIEDGEAILTAATPEGLPVAGAVVSWTLRASPAPLPPAGEFRFGDDVSPQSFDPRSGSGLTDTDGALRIPLVDGPAATPLRYELTAAIAEAGAPVVDVVRSFHAPGGTYAAIHLPSRIVEAARPAPIAVLATDGQGRPRPGAALRLEVLRRTWESVSLPSGGTGLASRDTLARSVELVAGDDGTARDELSLPAGEYRVRVAPAGGPVTAAASLWASRPGFADWGPEGGPERGPRQLLVADRTTYRPGDTATLLLASSAAPRSALVTIARPGEITGTVRALRPGEPLTLTLRAEDVPAVRVAVLAPPESGAAASLVAEATLPVVAEEPLSVSLTPSAPEYEPGATATLTVTTSASGAPVPASLIVALEGARGPALNSSLRTRGDGVAVLQIPLPAEPGLVRARVLAQAGERFGETTVELPVGPPLAARIVGPPFLRPGDQSELALLLRSTAAVTQEVAVAPEWTPPGLPAEPPGERRVTLPPGGSARLSWNAPSPDASLLGLRVRLRTAGGGEAEEGLTIPVQPALGATETISGSLVEGGLDADLAGLLGGDRDGLLKLEIVPSRAALLRQSIAALGSLESRGVLDEAALLLLGAALPEAASGAGVERLVALRNDDGGWGWWQSSDTAPFATAAALEALAAARDAGIAVSEETTARGLSILRGTARDRTARPDLRAYALYVLSRYGAAEPAPLSALAADAAQLGPDGAAYLLLARSPTEARADRRTLTRLRALARAEGGLFWSAPPDSALPRTDVALTALAARAIEHAVPGDPLVAQARAWLAARRPPGGWRRGYETAQAALTLAPALPERPAGYTVRLGDDELLAGAPGATETAAVLSAAPLGEGRARLAVSTPSGLLVSLRLVRPAEGDEGPREMALLREYLDPRTGERLDPASLAAGQLVRVRLTLVAAGARVFVDVEEPLAAGLTLVDAGAGDFDQAARGADRLLLSSALLSPGVYQHSYLARAAAPGSYRAPAAAARLLNGAVAGRGNEAVLVVAGRQ